MEPERLAQVEELFARAADLPVAERDAFLAAAPVDDEIRAEVRSLLAVEPRSLHAVVASALAATVPVSPTRLAGRFSVRGTLGVGGMGVVFEAFDESRREVVAIKTLDRMEPQAIYDLKREFRTLADVVHPRLVRMHELFRDGDRWFFSMQRLHGVPFIEHVRRDGALDEAALRRALQELVDGVRAIHRAGKLHCDLKPSNVLVCSGRVVILDFGLARPLAATARSTRLGGAGTPAYMAPEQIDAGGGTVASDWYAVGAMLYEALAGRWPHTGTLREVLEAKLAGVAPPDPRTFAPDSPPDLAALALALLAVDPALRPDEAQILAVVGEPSEGAAPVQAPEDVVFVGRVEELAALHDAHAQRPAVVRIVGASGIGKTALIDRFLSELGSEPVVLRGRCYERESVPFKALDEAVDALSRYLIRIGTIAAAKLVPRHAGELCRVFPALARVPVFADEQVPPELDPLELRRRAFGALREILARIGDRQPLVIAIDDVQWGDADSLRALSQLWDSRLSARALWLIGHRSGEEHSVFVRGLDALVPAGLHVRTIDLAPLSAEHARELVRARAAGAGDAAIDAIARESAGSPFLIGELVRGGQRPDAERRSLSELVRCRVVALPADARRLVELVVVAGRPVPLTAVLAAAATASDAAIPLLRAASLVRVLGGDGPALIDTYHDRIRESVAEHMSSPERIRDHRVLAEALEARPGPTVTAELLALLFRNAEVPDKARRYTIDAAHAASAAFAFERAAELYKIALELEEDRVARGRLERSHADALAGCGRSVDAADAYLRAAANANEDDTIDLEAAAAHQLLVTGHQARGHEIGRRVMARVGVRVPSSVRVGFVLALLYWVWNVLRGFPLHRKGTAPDSAAALRRFDLLWALYEGLLLNEAARALYFGMIAVSHGRRLADPGRRVKALGVLANLLPAMRGELGGRAATWSARQQQLATESGLPSPMAAYSMDAGLRCVLIGEWNRARGEFARAEELFAVSGASVTSRLNTQNGVAGALYYLGELHEYGELSKRLLAEARRLNNRAQIGTHGAGTTLGHLVADDVEAARREARESAPSFEAGFHLPGHYQCFAQTMVALYTGNVAAAREYVAAREADYRRARLFACHFVRCEWVWYRTLLALGALETGPQAAEFHALRAEAARFARELARSRIPSFVALAGIARASLASLAGEDAKPILEDTCRRLDGCSMSAFAAAVRWRLGELVGGDEGAKLVRDAEAFLREQRAVIPGRIARLFTPGFRSSL